MDIRSQTEQVYLVSCPFHYNPGSPAFAVNKESGLYYCHNPSCAQSGKLFELVQTVRNKGSLDAKAFVNERYRQVDYVALMERELAPVEFEPFSQDLLDRLKSQFPGSAGEKYMKGRGFTDETLSYFDIGFSPKRSSVTVPMHNDQGLPLGFVARSLYGKQFKNTKNLPKSKSAWNIHRAKRSGEAVIVCESSFDAMRIHQAGYPNVVALLGGSLSRYTQQQLERYFTTVIIMTDNDEPGRKLGMQIQDRVHRKILWAAVGPEVYPGGVKDACDLTDDEIREVLSNAVTSVQYLNWTESLV